MCLDRLPKASCGLWLLHVVNIDTCVRCICKYECGSHYALPVYRCGTERSHDDKKVMKVIPHQSQ